MNKETNIILIYIISGVILWCIGIDKGELYTKIIGASSMVIATLLNIYVLFKRS